MDSQRPTSRLTPVVEEKELENLKEACASLQIQVNALEAEREVHLGEIARLQAALEDAQYAGLERVLVCSPPPRRARSLDRDAGFFSDAPAQAVNIPKAKSGNSPR